jgi:hypothetical protein
LTILDAANYRGKSARKTRIVRQEDTLPTVLKPEKNRYYSSQIDGINGGPSLDMLLMRLIHRHLTERRGLSEAGFESIRTREDGMPRYLRGKSIVGTPTNLLPPRKKSSKAIPKIRLVSLGDSTNTLRRCLVW